MIVLRIIGGMVAVILFAGAVIGHRRRQVSRLTLIITGLISVGVVVLAITPNLFNPLFDILNFRPGSG